MSDRQRRSASRLPATPVFRLSALRHFDIPNLVLSSLSRFRPLPLPTPELPGCVRNTVKKRILLPLQLFFLLIFHRVVWYWKCYGEMRVKWLSQSNYDIVVISGFAWIQTVTGCSMERDEILIFCKFIKGTMQGNTVFSSSHIRICRPWRSRSRERFGYLYQNRSPNPFILVRIKEDIEGLVQRHVDIVRVREKMNPFLRERIEKEGRYVWQSLVSSILKQIINALYTIKSRTADIQTANDFTGSPAGMEKLDSICMLFIAVGDALKNIDKITGGTLLAQYPKSIGKGLSVSET